jgi:adenylylsulfate kinase
MLNNSLDILRENTFSIWLTGLSGSGKTTLAQHLSGLFLEHNIKMEILDGDNLRKGINNNLGYSIEDRKENVRRAAEISKLFNNFGISTLNAFICPTNQLRQMVAEIVGDNRYIEIFINTPLEVCEKRDTKGLYAKCRRGEIPEFTGITSPFEIPDNPHIVITTDKISPEDSANRTFELILDYICKR